MRKLQLASCSVAVVAGVMATMADVPQSAASLRVGTYNIRTLHADKRTENAWELRKDDLVALVRRLDFDVFGLQEAFSAQSAYIINALPEYALIGRFDGADYIYVSEGVRVLDYAVDASPRPGDVPLYPSDHFPLFATLEFPRQNKTKKGIRE